MLNVTAVGNLAKDPEQRQLDGIAVTQFTLLTNKTIKGEKVTSSLTCTVWGKRGQTVMDYIKKGDQITVSGSATIGAYLRNGGEPAGVIKLRVDDFTLPARPKPIQAPVPADVPF